MYVYMYILYARYLCIRIYRYRISYTEQRENHGPMMILDGGCYSDMYFGRVCQSDMYFGKPTRSQYFIDECYYCLI